MIFDKSDERSDYQRKVERLRALVKVGFDQIDQGLGTEINCEEDLTALMDKIEAKASLAVQRRNARK